MRNRIFKYIVPLAFILPLAGYFPSAAFPVRGWQDVPDSISGLVGSDTIIVDPSAEQESASEPTEEEPSAELSEEFFGDPAPSGNDSIRRRSAFDDIVEAKSVDSLVYNFKKKEVFLYEKGEVTYQGKKLEADYMQVDMETKLVHAHGRYDTVTKKPTRPVFTDGGNSFEMDTLAYNMDTGVGDMRGISTKDGEGILLGKIVKKMPDNILNIAQSIYTTCEADHPHFGIFITRGKVIPNKKVITGPAYLVMEDVPIPFLGLPFAFFPLASDKNSGFIVPSFGEEVMKGFFLRDGGYYFTFGDYADLSLTGGIYTFGSWETSAISRYVKRYHWNGGLNVRYTKDIISERGLPDYVNQNNFRIAWTHMQDPKLNPNSTLSASVNFSSSGFSKYGATTLNEHLNTQTNSSIAYTKSWAGKPYSLSANLQHSQNSRDTTVSLSMPNMVFNVSRINPFKRREMVGRQRWYEKIALNYTGSLQNNVTVHERDMFTRTMFDQMRNGVNHVIPISTSMNILKYLNITPNASYNERWYFQKIEQSWNGDRNRVERDTLSGFYRVWDYRFALGASTKIYGQINSRQDSKALIRAVRHVITPSISANYIPDFSAERFGYYSTVQTDSLGTMTRYSPFQHGIFGIPGSGAVASLSFNLQQTLEMKVRDERDTTGMRKISVIDNLSISSAYNFLADSLNLAPFSISFRTTITKNVSLNVSASMDPYQLDPVTGARINKFMWSKGSPGRITSAGTSFGYTFNSSTSPAPVSNDITTQSVIPNHYMDQGGNIMWDQMDALTRRQYMPRMYYDFSIPWNFGFNYSFSYSKPGLINNITQTIGFNGSLTLGKWGMSFNGGYDVKSRSMTPGTVAVARDLHCWQMFFSWVPIGTFKSWNFTIAVRSSMLKDLKYDRNSSRFDNLLD